MQEMYTKIWVAIAVVVTLIILAVSNAPHRCIDPEHQTCDGQCVCDGMECN